jgi:hypothetical protein
MEIRETVEQEKRVSITLSIKEICRLLQMLDVKNCFKIGFLCAIRRD